MARCKTGGNTMKPDIQAIEERAKAATSEDCKCTYNETGCSGCKYTHLLCDRNYLLSEVRRLQGERDAFKLAASSQLDINTRISEKAWEETCEAYKDGCDKAYKELMNWRGLMRILDKEYPASIYTGMSGDIGPLVIVKLREINELRNMCRE
jgi:hypothetical protein